MPFKLDNKKQTEKNKAAIQLTVDGKFKAGRNVTFANLVENKRLNREKKPKVNSGRGKKDYE